MTTDFSDEALQNYPLANIDRPSKWGRVALSEIASEVSPGFASGKHNAIGSGVPHLRPMNVSRDGQIDLEVVKSVAESGGVELLPGDVLFNNTNSPELVGKTAVISERETGFAFSNHMTRIRLERGVSAAFVARQLHFLWMCGYMKRRCTNHVNQASISSTTLAGSIPILLPSPAEQDRIVAKLEELLSDLDAGVAELKAAQKKLQQYRQSLLKAAVEGALTADWREAQRQQGTPTETGAQLLARILTERRARWEAKQLAKFKEQGKAPPKDWQKEYLAPAALEKSDCPALPESWAWTSLGECFQVAVGATPSRKEATYWGGEIPWVSSGEVRFTRIRATKELITEAGLNNSSTRINPIGSVLLGMIGEGKTRGQVAIIDIAAANNQNCAAIWVSDTSVPSEFVYYWLWSRYDETRRGSSGNNQPALNKSIVERIAMPLAPTAEMQEVVKLVTSTMEQIARQESAVALSLKQSIAQRQNVLRAAFAGQLVTQEPSDEPASALLERIRSQRVERTTQPRSRKTKKYAEA